MRYCTDCGEELGYDIPSYYSRCTSCFKTQKRAEATNLAAELERQRALAEKYKRLAVERRLELEALKSGGGNVPGLTQDRIKAMLLLVHPDRHSNSRPSNEITAWLLSELRARREGR